MTAKNGCRHCKFWREGSPDENYFGIILGWCRRNPPIIFQGARGAGDYITQWPETYETEACGEFKKGKSIVNNLDDR